MLNRTLLTGSLALVLLTSSGIAMAGPDKTKKKRDKEVLRGPDISTTDSASPKDGKDNANPMNSMSPKKDKAAQRDARPIVFREYTIALRQMKDSLGLTQPQEEHIKVIMRDHRKAMKEFQELNRDKIKAMREKVKATAGGKSGQGKKDKKTGQPAVDSAKNNADPKSNQSDTKSAGTKARESIRNFVDNAKPNKDAISKLNKVLSQEQLAMLKAKALENRAKQGARDHAQGQKRKGPKTHRKNMNSDQVDRTKNKEQKKSHKKGGSPSKSDP